MSPRRTFQIVAFLFGWIALWYGLPIFTFFVESLRAGWRHPAYRVQLLKDLGLKLIPIGLAVALFWTAIALRDQRNRPSA